MKKLVMCLILLMAIVIPIACGNSNTTPTALNSSSSAATATRTSTPVSTPGSVTPTPTTAVLTVTPAATYSSPTPVYQNNYPASAAPNGIYIDTSSSPATAYVAEGEPGVTMLERYVVGNGSLNGGLWGNQISYGYPTPGLSPAWQGTTITLAKPQAWFANSANGGNIAVLDSSASGAATLYTGSATWSAGTASVWNQPAGVVFDTYLMPVTCNGYSGLTFTSPRGMAMDSLGMTVYVADTGNARVDALYAANNGNPQYPNPWIHYWNYFAPGIPFKTPSSIILDSNNTIWVTDAGYSPSVIEAYTSGGTTVLNNPVTTISGCVATGLAVTITAGPVTHLYVADSGNNLIEEYLVNNTGGVILTAATLPVTFLESTTFKPYSIGLAPGGGGSTNIIVGDIGNDKIEVFQVPNP
ncbi:MAG TPA: hypothetical protein VK791_08100 [bacterium]|jgi:hypothetical protein|nr:hypothetical protein [bacterium]